MEKILNEVTVVRIVPEFKQTGGGSKMDYKEHAIKINPHIKHQILIAPFDAHISRSFDNQFQFQIIRVKSQRIEYSIPFISWSLNNIFLYLKIYKLVKQIPNIDIILAHENTPIAYSCIIGRLLGIPVIGMIHGTAEAYSFYSGFKETILAILFKPAHALIVDSGTRAPEKFQTLWNGRITIVNHGLDLDFFYPKEKDKSILKKLNLNESDLIVFSLSNLIPIKNIDLAIEVFEKVITHIPGERIFLILAGDGHQKEELVKLVYEKGLNMRVIFLGLIPYDEVPNYISIADVCIGMSIKDNMNRSILEPMACGKPIVAFDGGNIEKLIITGNNGFLVKRGDLSDFAQKIICLLEHPISRREMGKHARETIIEKRSWDKRIRQDLDVYQKIIKSTKKC